MDKPLTAFQPQSARTLRNVSPKEIAWESSSASEMPKEHPISARGRFSRDGDRPVSEDTLFEIGSITKVFTAILLGNMVERHLGALDDPVQAYLPSSARMPSRGDKRITLGDLATHRSGLLRMPDNFEPKDVENPFADYTEERMVQFLAGYELTRDIGTTHEYSNLGAGLLGSALSRRAGTSFEQLLIDRIGEPLGLKDTRITLSEEQRARLAQGHVAGRPAKNWDIDALAGAGGVTVYRPGPAPFSERESWAGRHAAGQDLASHASESIRNGAAGPLRRPGLACVDQVRHDDHLAQWRDGGLPQLLRLHSAEGARSCRPDQLKRGH